MRPAPRWFVGLAAMVVGLWLAEDVRGRVRLHLVERKWAARSWALTAEAALERGGGKRGAPTVVDAIREGNWNEPLVGMLRENTRRHAAGNPSPEHGTSRPVEAFLGTPLPESPTEAFAIQLREFDAPLAMLNRALAASDIQGWDPFAVPLFGEAQGHPPLFCSPSLPMYVLSVRAELAVATHDSRALLAALEAMIDIANATRKPAFLTQDAINRFQTRRFILVTAWLSLREQIWDADTIEAFAVALDAWEADEDLPVLALNEVVLLKEAWRRQSVFQGFQTRRRLVHDFKSSTSWGSLAPADLEEQVHAMRDIIIGWLLPPGAFDHWFAMQLDRLAGIASRGSRLSSFREYDATWWEKSVPIGEIIPIHYPGLETRHITGMQQRDLLRVAILLEREHLRNGEYPAILPPGCPPDRFWPSQSPRYERTTDGRFLLYSVGEDRRDDRGDPRADIVWRYSPP